MGFASRAVLLAGAGLAWTAGGALAQRGGGSSAAHSVAYREEVRIAVGNSGDHFVTDQQTAWRIRSSDTLVMLVDSSLRVVRVAINGKRSRWGRIGSEVVIPQPGSPGDTLVTRMRFHGVPTGRNWFAIPRDSPDSALLLLTVEVPRGAKPVTDGMATAVLEGVDSLPYGRTSWRFHFDRPVALSRLRLEMTRPGSR